MKLTALEIDRYQHMTHGFKSLAADQETEPLLKKLAEILDHLEPQGIDNYHSVFVCAPRPTFRHYFESHGESSYEEASEEEIAQVKKITGIIFLRRLYGSDWESNISHEKRAKSFTVCFLTVPSYLRLTTVMSISNITAPIC